MLGFDAEVEKIGECECIPDDDVLPVVEDPAKKVSVGKVVDLCYLAILLDGNTPLNPSRNKVIYYLKVKNKGVYFDLVVFTINVVFC